MKLVYLMAFFCLMSIENQAQEVSLDHYADSASCFMTFTIVQTTPKYDGDLEEYLKQTLSKDCRKFRGPLNINLLIDSFGRAYLMGLYPAKQVKYVNNIAEVVKEMPQWIPAQQNKRNVCYLLRMELFFEKDRIYVSYKG
ncbi:hypothetical protein ACI6Q2_20400 [Chitinophagaceae bacterium LWZ2-11]